jgi:translation elongation factor P/translation initiation factor 5A
MGILQAERQKMDEKIDARVEEKLQQYLANQGNALVLSSPDEYRSSCASITAIENDKNCYHIDDLK